MMWEENDQREQQLAQISAKAFAEIWQKRILSIKKDYETNQQKYDQEIIDIMENLLLGWEQLYDGQTKDLHYVIISSLNSGVITRSYELRRFYALYPAYITMFYMDKIMQRVYELPVWSKIAAQDIRIMYGTYMERMVEISKRHKEVEK